MMDEKEKRIEALIVKRRKATIELDEMNKERKKMEAKLGAWKAKMKEKAGVIRSFSAEIGAIKTGEKKGKVTDHAIVRYLERYKDFDIEALANEILEHPDAKMNDLGLVTTVYKEELPMSKEVSDILKLAKLKKIV